MRTFLLAAAMAFSAVSWAKGPMVDGKFRVGDDDNAFHIRFVTANTPATTTRIADCSAFYCQGDATRVKAFCPKANGLCEFLRDLVVVTTQVVDSAAGDIRWRIVYARVDALGDLSYVGELEAGTFGEAPTWRFAGGSTRTPLIPE